MSRDFTRVISKSRRRNRLARATLRRSTIFAAKSPSLRAFQSQRTSARAERKTTSDIPAGRWADHPL